MADPVGSMPIRMGTTTLVPPDQAAMPIRMGTTTLVPPDQAAMPIRMGTTTLVPPEELGIQQRASQAAQQRYAQSAPSTPPALQGQYGGTYFGPEYDAAVASGKFTPQQIAAAEAAKARYASTPLGLTAQRLGLESESRKADLTYAGKEQEALALAAERENKAREAAEVSDRAQMERFEQMRSEFDQAQAKRIRDMDDLRTEIATTKIDPAQYFAKGNGFGNALSLLSVALGGFAEGYSGGRLKNNALAMLQNSIAQDIEAQKANLANKRGALAESQSLYGMARQRFGDDQAATEYTKARQNELLKNQALRFANEGRTDAIRANAQKLAQHFDIESKLSDNRVKQMFADAEAARIRSAAGAMAASKTAEERRIDKELERATKIAALRKTGAETEKLESEAAGGSEAQKGKEVVNYKGEQFLVDKSAAVALRAAAAAAEASEEQTNALITKSAGSYHTLLPGMSKKQSEAQPLLGSLQASMATVLSSGGMPSDKAEANARKIVSEVPQFQSEENWAAGIKKVPAMLDSKVRSMLKASDAQVIGEKPSSDYKIYKSKK